MSDRMQPLKQRCRVCGGDSEFAGRKFGKFSSRWYELRHCAACRFSFVADPWTDFSLIYSEDYYRGKGVDPSVDYEFELMHPDETIRVYEWAGLFRVISGLVSVDQETRWLDFGCGNGGLVRHVREQVACDIVGFEEGHIAERAKAAGLPLISNEQLEKSAGYFDVITAVEVLEHTVDPVETIRTIGRLLKPGGLFFLTTGNARPFRGRLAQWSYVVPEIHISFFEPETLARVMKKAGLQPEFRGWLPGFENIIRFKVLKSLGIRRRSSLARLLSSSCPSRLVDAYFGGSKHPVGWGDASAIKPVPG